MNMYEFSVKTRVWSDLEMAFFTKIGTVFEHSMCHLYKKLPPKFQLISDTTKLPANSFGRIAPHDRKTTLQSLFSQIKIDFETCSSIRLLREYYIYRNLYAHQNAVADAHYLSKLEKIIKYADVSIQVEALKEARQRFAGEDLYWDMPLRRLGVFLDAAEEAIRLVECHVAGASWRHYSFRAPLSYIFVPPEK